MPSPEKKVIKREREEHIGVLCVRVRKKKKTIQEEMEGHAEVLCVQVRKTRRETFVPKKTNNKIKEHTEATNTH